MAREGPSVLSRLFTIVARLKENRQCSCNSLANELEVSPRTIRRDLDLLRDSFGAPIEWEPSTKTWFFTRPWEGLGDFQLNSAESLALIIAQQSFRRIRHTPIAAALHAILERIAQTADPGIRASWESLARTVHPLAASPAEERENEHFAPIADAIRKHRVLEIHYTKPGDDHPEIRHIHPLGLAERDQRWIVVSRDPAAPGDGIRKFLLARMEVCRRLPATFTPPADFDLAAYLGGSLGLFTGDTAHTVEATFSAYAAPYLRESPWHPSQSLTPLPDGHLRATWQVNHLLDIQRRLLSWGEHVTVHAPPELRQAFSTIAQNFSEKYLPHPPPRTHPDRGPVVRCE